jgi:hypothetical protein
MDEFIDRLPARLAALAGIMVGSVSLYGGTSLLGVGERVLVAMIVFGLLGAILKLLIQQSALEQNYQVQHMGRHLDASTPSMTADDLGYGDGHRGEIS